MIYPGDFLIDTKLSHFSLIRIFTIDVFEWARFCNDITHDIYVLNIITQVVASFKACLALSNNLVQIRPFPLFLLIHTDTEVKKNYGNYILIKEMIKNQVISLFIMF